MNKRVEAISEIKENIKIKIEPITGPDKIFFGIRKEDNTSIYITKPSFVCGWYWSFGHLGNRNEHYRLESYQEKQKVIIDSEGELHIFTENRNISLYDALLADYELNPKILENICQFCELSLTIYALKEVAEIVHRGGSHQTTNLGRAYLKDAGIYNKLVAEFIPKQCQTLWDLIG